MACPGGWQPECSNGNRPTTRWRIAGSGQASAKARRSCSAISDLVSWLASVLSGWRACRLPRPASAKRTHLTPGHHLCSRRRHTTAGELMCSIAPYRTLKIWCISARSGAIPADGAPCAVFHAKQESALPDVATAPPLYRAAEAIGKRRHSARLLQGDPRAAPHQIALVSLTEAGILQRLGARPATRYQLNF
jgi:hypothetical protein